MQDSAGHQDNGTGRGRRAAALVAALAVAGVLTACNPLVPGTTCPMFPGTSHWHADVSALPVRTNSAAIVATVGVAAGLKADFGSGLWDGGPIGIPYVVVPGDQAPRARQLRLRRRERPRPLPGAGRRPHRGRPGGRRRSATS